MRKAVIRNGDPTTTGGTVVAYSSNIRDGGNKIALDNDEATCGNCAGAFRIFGTGQGMSQQGRAVVVEGDLVLCPCRRNRVLIGGNPRIFITCNEGGVCPASADATAPAVASSTARVTYDEQVWVEVVSVAAVGYPYCIETADGRIRLGRVDETGVLPRIATGAGFGEYIVYWGDEALAKSFGGE